MAVGCVTPRVTMDSDGILVYRQLGLMLFETESLETYPGAEVVSPQPLNWKQGLIHKCPQFSQSL